MRQRDYLYEDLLEVLSQYDFCPIVKAETLFYLCCFFSLEVGQMSKKEFFENISKTIRRIGAKDEKRKKRGKKAVHNKTNRRNN